MFWNTQFVSALIFQYNKKDLNIKNFFQQENETMLERIYNPITAMGFSAMFTFQLDNTKR